MAVAYCLECGARIYMGRKPWIGQAVFCDRCEADMEVTRVSPLQLELTENLIDRDTEYEHLSLDVLTA